MNLTSIKSLALLFVATATFISCDNTVEIAPEDQTQAVEVNTENLTLQLSGDIVASPRYPSTSGKVKISTDADNNRTLTLENLNVSNGPDLRIYIAEDAAITNFVEVSNTVKNGTNSYELPSSVDLEKQKVVLIWCKAFSVSFGSATLTAP